MTRLIDGQGRLLNHVELLYRPGERQLTGQVFEILGCGVVESGGPYLVIPIVEGSDDTTNNVIYASEVTPEQWRFEQMLQSRLANEPELAGAYEGYAELLRREPQRATHFGIRFPAQQRLEETVDRIRGGLGPDLQGRLEVSAVFYPGDQGALSPTLIQAFVKTDVFAAGLITMGQHVELQAVQGS